MLSKIPWFLTQEKCLSEHLQTIKDKEQQEALALEELELQKKALQLECDKRLEAMQQEVETFRTVSNRLGTFLDNSVVRM